MINISEILSLSLGFLGATTGIISLIWHINNNKSRLMVKYLYYRSSLGEFIPGEKSTQDILRVYISFQNRGNRSTTIEYVWLRVDNHSFHKCHKPFIIFPNSSKKYHLLLPLMTKH